MRSLLLCSFVLFLLAACQPKEQDFVKAESLLCDSVVLPNIDQSFGVAYALVDNDIHISYFSYNNKKVFVFSYKSKNVIDSIDINPNMATRDFYVDENGSLYLLDKHTSNIYYKQRKDTPVYYKVVQYSTQEKQLFPAYIQFDVRNNSIVLYNVPAYRISDNGERKAYFESKILLELKKNNDTFYPANEFGTFPEIYQKDFFDETLPLAARAANDHVYYIFSSSNTIFDYNLKNKNTAEHAIQELPINNLTPYDLSKLGDFNYKSEYNIGSSRYAKMLADQKNNQLLVFQILPLHASTNRSEQTLFIDKPVDAFLLNDNFSLSKKIHFPDMQKLFFNNSFLYDHQLLIQERNDASNKNLKVYVFKL